MKRITRVAVQARDSPRRVHADRDGSLTLARTCTWSLEGGYLSIGAAHEAVINIARIKIRSRDNPRRVDADGDSSLMRASACARSLEGGGQGENTGDLTTCRITRRC